ncbi:hypothetical protein ANTHELSMS3_00311 [Antarctobacter heliothermus]|uniref:Peptidase M23 n=2 Tax=Antarctobacter heliothermus TaxID=74033 RepID=A0A222DYI6_9RHOB|nr:hypothetical protein ANTHELSMS3_00311 [Antarctobacter heliothermus]
MIVGIFTEKKPKGTKMKTVLTFVAALLAAAPALAHEGGHLHPHGVESGMSLLPMAALIGVAALVAWNRR